MNEFYNGLLILSGVYLAGLLVMCALCLRAMYLADIKREEEKKQNEYLH